eukprot:Nk52_evm33s805 gene=Nk52_evmTU33s805
MAIGFEDDDEWDDFSVATPPPVVMKQKQQQQQTRVVADTDKVRHVNVSLTGGDKKNVLGSVGGEVNYDAFRTTALTDPKVELPTVVRGSGKEEGERNCADKGEVPIYSVDDEEENEERERERDRNPTVDEEKQGKGIMDVESPKDEIKMDDGGDALLTPIEHKKRCSSEADSMVAALEKAENEHLQAKIKALTGIVQSLARDKENLEIEMRALKQSSNASELYKAEAQKQKTLYRTLQEKHQQQIEEMKKSGSESLAIVVEDYNAQMKQAIADEAAQNKTLFVEFIEKQAELTRKENDLKLKESIAGWEQDREEMLSEIREVALKDLDVLKERLENDFAIEKKKWRGRFEDDLKKEVELTKGLVEEMVEERVLKAKAEMDDYKESAMKLIEENGKASKELLKETVEHEREVAVEYIEKALSEERGRFDENLAARVSMSKDIVAATSEKIDNLLQNQSQLLDEKIAAFKMEMQTRLDDDAVKKGAINKRMLRSMDFFLENMQTQVKSLLVEEE